jgi:hypothetical protein
MRRSSASVRAGMSHGRGPASRGRSILRLPASALSRRDARNSMAIRLYNEPVCRDDDAPLRHLAAREGLRRSADGELEVTREVGLADVA